MSHRILAKLDIKHGKVIKGVEFEGVRQVGDPIELAKKYYKEQIDEIIYCSNKQVLSPWTSKYHDACSINHARL